MLIQALCEYYDILSETGKIMPDGYSNVKVHYLICLSPEGRVERILNVQVSRELKDAKGKVKIRWDPVLQKMPKRSEKPGIDSNLIEHRPLYIFGLNYDNERFSPEDRTGKARKSHEDFVKKNLAFIEGIDSPVVNAYRNFIRTWRPEEETKNLELMAVGKNYGNSGFAFCLVGRPDRLLQEDEKIIQRWEEYRRGEASGTPEKTGQCSITGQELPMARIHGKIKGIAGGLATGTVLIGYNNASENSYGNEQSYNSNISEQAMKKYTEALNFLLADDSHKVILDELTVVWWSMSKNPRNDSLLKMLMFDDSDTLNLEQTERMLKDMMRDARTGKLVPERLKAEEEIDPDVTFYILGLKPNSSRVSVKFLYRRRFGDILKNIAQHQNDLQVTEELKPVSLQWIGKQLISPKIKDGKAPSALYARIFESILYGREYPEFLFATVVRRIKTDLDIPVNRVRAGIIKAYINRSERLKGEKEELSVALDKDNQNEAYLCGRLFAVLEQLQYSASGGKLNRTIRDAYFSSAAAKPAIIFPKLLKLAQNHLKKAKAPVFYNKYIAEIIDNLNGTFPETLSLKEQGKFIIGYYHQQQRIFDEMKEIKEEARKNVTE